MLMLITSELSEALEADRKNHYAFKSFNLINNCDWTESELEESVSKKLYFQQEFTTSVKNSFEDEIADVIIQVMDLCGAKNIDIDWHIEQKMKYNALRPHKHGKKY